MINQIELLDDEKIVPALGEDLQYIRSLNIFIGSAWRKSGLDPCEWAIFCNLLSQSDEYGRACPSAEGLAQECKMSRRQVFACLKALKDKSFIDSQHRKTSDGSNSTNIYTILGVGPLVHLLHHPPSAQKGSSLLSSSSPSPKPPSSSPSLSPISQKRVSAISAKPKKEELDFFVTSLGLTQEDCDAIWDQWLTNGFRTTSGPIKDWQACVRNYKRQGWLPSQKFHKEQPKRAPSVFSRARPSL